MRKLMGVLAGLAFAATMVGTNSARATLVYQWNFNSGGAPNVSGGGGNLTVTNSIHGASNFGGTGVSGGATDRAYDGYGGANQYNTADPAGVASTAAGDVLTGLGTLTDFTVTFWMKPSNPFPLPTQNGSTINARLLMVGTSSTYDQGAGGLELSMNASDKLQKGVNGNNPISTNTFSTFLPANGMSTSDWVFVAFGYDGNSGNNVFFDPVIQAATGNADNNNAYVYLGSPSVSPVLFDSSGVLATGNVSPGPVSFGSNAFAFVGNRSSLSRDFTGLIDNVQIYNSVLSASDLDAVRASAIPEPVAAALLGIGAAAQLLRRRPGHVTR